MSLLKRFKIIPFLICVFFWGCSKDTVVEPNDNAIIPLKTDITHESLDGELNRRIPELMEIVGIPGLQVAVIKDGDILWENGFGVKSNSTREEVDNQSIFQAASLSKVVFTYAVLKLVENGYLELDRPLSEYTTDEYIIDHFNRGNPLDERIRLITARMVLTHSTGFPNWRDGQPITFINNPGERFSYSGEGFVFLQIVLEHLLAQSLNEMMTELVFDPLGMTRSSYVWKEEMGPHITNGHLAGGQVNSIARPQTGNSAGSLLTTANDYAKFMLALLNHIGIQESTVNQMLSQQIEVPIEFGDESELSDHVFWGLGIGLQFTDQGSAFWHWGDNHDFKCFMVAFPESEIGLVFFTNSYNGLMIAKELLQTAIGGYYPAIDWMN